MNQAHVSREIKLRAHQACLNAVKLGIIKKGPCAKCGSTVRLHKHHEDYDKPLEIVWLCHSCHSKYHAIVKRERNRGNPLPYRFIDVWLEHGDDMPPVEKLDTTAVPPDMAQFTVCLPVQYGPLVRELSYHTYHELSQVFEYALLCLEEKVQKGEADWRDGDIRREEFVSRQVIGG